MTSIFFRVWFDNRQASAEQMAAITDVRVSQEMDMAFSAELEMPLALDSHGVWQAVADREPFSRVRIDIKLDDKKWSALIDGQVTGYRNLKQREPNHSTKTLVIHDVTKAMNRDELVSELVSKTDKERVEELIKPFGSLLSNNKEIEKTENTGNPPPDVQRGTAMSHLIKIGKRQGKHAYVLPGDLRGGVPGKPVFHFTQDPKKNSGLPPLIQSGPKANLASLEVKELADKAVVVKLASIRFSDKAIIRAKASPETPRDQQPAREMGMLLADPLSCDLVDLDQAAKARARELGYRIIAEGQVLSHCYGAALQPYQLVTIQTSRSDTSGDYLLTRVDHRITRSFYSQSFRAKRVGPARGKP